MQWKNDKFGELKWLIFDVVRNAPEMADVIKQATIADLTDSVDCLFERLLKNIEEEK
jgi:hypothetical protein